MLVWLAFFTVLIIVGYVLLWYVVVKYIVKDDWIIVISEKKKKLFMVPLLYLLYCLLISLRSPIYDSTLCWRDGEIQKMQTQYSWIMGQCQGKTNNGVFMEMKKQRGLPGGDEHDKDTANDHSTQ